MLCEAVNIRKTYQSGDKKLDVLRGIDFSLKKGEIVSIIGPSGAGKSTFLHILGGLDQPSQGMVKVDDEEVYRLNDTQRSRLRNRRFGFIFQFYHLLPEFNALENVILPLFIRDGRGNPKSYEKKGEEMLERVGLAGRLTHRPNQLSGGEQQRVAIARALVTEPDMVLCDEPTGNLDSVTGKGIVELLIKMNKDHQQTLLIVTHDESLAELSDRVLYMRDGLLE